MMVMTSPMKKILLWTHQMATRTEDSLVFSWEGRHVPFHFAFILDIYLGHLIFIFAIDFLSFASILVVYLYVCDLHSEFTSISCLHFMPSVNFLLFAKILLWRDIFALRNIFTNAMKQRFLAIMNHSEPFLFHFDLYVSPRFYCDLIYFSSTSL